MFAKDPILLACTVTVVLPFLSFLTIICYTRKWERVSCSISIGAILTSLLCAIYLFVATRHFTEPLQYKLPWIISGKTIIPFGFLVDHLSMLMLVIVAVIASLVQIYSLGYMAGDPGFSRYYAFQSLFAWAMMTMSVAPSMIQFYIFWELVGLASYLLIGFYYEKWSASQAGKKAFVVTRIGDVGMFIGLVILLLFYGNLGIVDVNSAAVAKQIPVPLITISAILIFCGVIGKSAQFPLLTWLPDAMEGPTPVSALLHSATMVAAGVYMFARLFPFFAGSADALQFALLIGTITMVLSSTMAMVARDIKQVWAYSTVSQLGYMVMALGAGGYFSGMFHLTTHAGFKALLFLCSGVFIHHYHTNDFFVMSRQGARNLKVPMVCMTIGALALSGVFPFSGFFSKESIMVALASHPNKIWLAAGLFGEVLTAYYTFRLIFVMLFPKEIEEHHHHEEEHHEGEGILYWLMGWPLIILASLTCVLGFFEKWFEHYLFGDYILAHGMEHGAEAAHSGGHWLTITAIVLVLIGVAVAWLEYGRKGASQEGFLSRMPAIEKLFANRWYMDHFYRWALDTIIYSGFTNIFTRNDRRVIDGGIDGLCRGTEGSGRIASFLQSNMVQYNIFVMVAVLGFVALSFLG
ncbi:MAG TPA: NADH-quinone oxidoreductase subunit L [Deltaproteobacteria bacterium]|nr:MAG: NADH-quinone oxidoreductase subunit L [Deltaproteobacteria bacterium]HDM74921.1 NADH-quinone oxidoreductase subunit L [Deltaproteobacteria bacterium]